MVQMEFLAANHVRIVGLCGQNWNRTLCYSFSLRSLRPRNVFKYLTNVYHTTIVHCLACRGHWALGSAQLFTVYSLRHSLITQLSNCQDGCQTNSRRYDDLFSTDRVDLSNTYRVIVLVWVAAVFLIPVSLIRPSRRPFLSYTCTLF